MMIKSFTAESAAAALKQVRSEMGGDAVVLKTRHVTNGAGLKRIEVTACLDQPPAATKQATVAERARLNGAIGSDNRKVTEPRWTRVKQEESVTAPPTNGTSDDKLTEITERFAALEAKLEQLTSNGSQPEQAKSAVGDNPEIEKLREQFRKVDLPEVYSSVFLSTLDREYTGEGLFADEAGRLLTYSLSDLIGDMPECNPGDVVVVVGSAGVGKTSLIGKLAVKLVTEQKKKVRLLSLDTSKVGAHDEIESYAAILGIDVADGTDAEQMSSPDSVTLIDTSAMPNATEPFAAFARTLDQVKPTHRIAVFSSLTRSTDIVRQAKQIRALNPSSFAVSMLDLTDCHGPIVAAAETLEAKLVMTTNGPGGIGSLARPDASTLAGSLLRAEVDHE